MNRPAIWAAGALALGILFGTNFSAPAAYVAGAFLLAGMLLFGWSRSRGALDRTMIVAVLATLGAVLAAWHSAMLEHGQLSHYLRDKAAWGTLWTLEGTVRTGWLYREAQYGRMIVDVDAVHLPEGRMGISGGLSVRCSEPPGPIPAGTRVRVRGRVDPTLSAVNFHTSCIEDYFRTRGVAIGMTVKANAITTLGVDSWRPAHWAERLRQAEADLLARHVPRDALPFVLAVWLGAGSMLPAEEYDAFVVSGTAHVLSVSGVHVAIIYVTLAGALSWLGGRKKLRAALVIVGVFAYALLAGAHVATMRSALMFALYLAAEFFDREPDAGTTLGLAALLFLVVDPMLVYDAGFLLSFLSVASMLLFSDAIRDRLPWRLGPLREGIAASVSAQILSFPMAAKYFQLIPVYGIAANLVVVPLLTGVIWLCVLTTLAGATMPPAGDLFGAALGALAGAVRWLVELVAGLPGSRALLSAPTWYAVPIFWGAALCAARALRAHAHSRGLWFAAAVLALATMALWPPRTAGPAVEMLDVGHGDAMFIRTPGGTTLLIDGGDRDEFRDLGRQVVVPALLARGVHRLDYVVCTHPDRDHIGGLMEVVRLLRVGELIMGGGPSGAPLESALLREALARDIPVRYVQRGDKIAANGAQMDVLHPGEDFAALDKPNDRSVVLRVAWPGFSLLCTGDLEATGEAALARQGLDQAALLKVPHHGSNTSSTGALLDAVRPRAALCSTDAGPNRRAVHPDVSARYAERGIPLLRTDHLGGLRVVFDTRGAWRLEGAREARGYTLTPAAGRAE